MKQTNKPHGDFFLPDFCGLNSVFAVVILAQLFAFILTLAGHPQSRDLWYDLALISLFMQWVGLSCAAVLCACRPWLSRLSDGMAGAVGYLLLMLTIGLLSEAAWRISELTGMGISGPTHTDFLLRNLTIGAIVAALALRYFYVQSQWRQGIRAEAGARLQALQARIRPHFLFNSINTISSLIHRHPAQAEEALLDLADLFRANLGEEHRHIPLADELELTRRYLRMEALRLGDRLQVSWEVETDCEALLIPPLILQPLVENAVYHGIEPRRDGGCIEIVIHCADEQLQVAIRNPLPEGVTAQHDGNHIAMENIAQRLYAHYRERAHLAREQRDGEFVVSLILPRECAQ